MSLSKRNTLLIPVILWISLAACGEKQQTETTTFTRSDSLTDAYLTLQDSLHVIWNTMINDDNQKIKVMKSLFHELEVCGQFDPEVLHGIGVRLDQLPRIRYSVKTMWNADVIDEYDFASQSLVNELITLAESHKGYSYNKALQYMVDEIRSAEMRVENYRMEYDSLAMTFNSFIDHHQNFMKELAGNGEITKKPLFQLASE